METYQDKFLAKWAEEEALVDALHTDPPLTLLFYPRVLTESFLPRRQSRLNETERTYRNIRVSVRNAEGPLPFGILPRKFLLFCATRAIQNKSRVIDLPSERQLFTLLGIPRCAKNQKAIRQQIRRLSSTYIKISYVPNRRRTIEHRGMIFESISLERDDIQLPLFSSRVVFSEAFYENVLKTVNPFHGDMIANLSSALALDVFLWLSIRLPRITKEKPETITVSQLQEQFGQPGERRDNFIKAFKTAWVNVGRVWPAALSSLEFEGKKVVLKYASDLVPLDNRSGQFGW